MKHLPNALTIINLMTGFAGILLVFRGRYELVLLCALICLVSDVADGWAARLLGHSSEIGKELDSLADIVSFGVLPGSILSALYADQCAENLFGIVFPAIIPAATALRLAIYNTDRRENTVFYGLPSPSSASVVFGILMMVHFQPGILPSLFCVPFVFAGSCAVLAILLLSNIRLWSLKGLGLKHGKVILAGLLATAAVAVVIFSYAALPVMVAAYIAFGILNIWIKAY